jgi:hypothetical protein
MKNPNVMVGLALTSGVIGLAAGGVAVADLVKASNYEDGQGVVKPFGPNGDGYVAVENGDTVVKDGQLYGSFYPVETAINKAYDDAQNLGISALSAEIAMSVGLLRVRKHHRRLREEADAAEMQQLWDTRHEDWNKE